MSQETRVRLLSVVTAALAVAAVLEVNALRPWYAAVLLADLLVLLGWLRLRRTRARDRCVLAATPPSSRRTPSSSPRPRPSRSPAP
jgi:hypothetical protein